MKMEYSRFLDIVEERGRSNFRTESYAENGNGRLGCEVEDLHLHTDTLTGLPNTEFLQTPRALAERPYTVAKREASSPYQEVIGVEFRQPFSPYPESNLWPAFDYDFSLQAEAQTEAVPTIEEVLAQVAMVRSEAWEAAPEGTGF
ncbi:MAG: hypothetical protein SVW77_03060 [Candidatus Nanohaloarchaea archaeon]|nr:hypothetical protein [Candidatus Nanohaloarchaea archaeon]